MRPSRNLKIVVGLTFADLAANALGYRLIFPLDLLAILSMLIFVGLAYDIRKALGETNYRQVLTAFAILLLLNARSSDVVESVPGRWQWPIGLVTASMLLCLIWEFSKRLDWDDPNVRENLFGTARRGKRSANAS